MAVRVVEEVEEAAHPLTRRLHRLLDELAGLTADALGGVDDDSSEADRIDQLAVLGLLAEGRTAAAIGRRLMISERTVHKHLEHVYATLGVTDRPRARGADPAPDARADA